MGVTEIITAVIAFIKVLPQLIGIVKELVKYVNELADFFDRLSKIKEIKEAIKTARETKDTSKLEDAFGIKPSVIEQKLTEVVSPSENVKIRFLTETKTPVEEKKSPEFVKEEPTAASLPVEPKPTVTVMRFLSGTKNVAMRVMGLNAVVGGQVKGANLKLSPLGNHNAQRMGSKFVLLALVIFLGSCKTVPNQPNYKPKLYAGDSSQGAVVRAQSHEVYSCQDPEFDNFVALRYEDLQCLYLTYIQNCERYKDPNPTCPKVSQDRIDKIMSRVKNP